MATDHLNIYLSRQDATMVASMSDSQPVLQPWVKLRSTTAFLAQQGVNFDLSIGERLRTVLFPVTTWSYADFRLPQMIFDAYFVRGTKGAGMTYSSESASNTISGSKGEIPLW
jgi:hypothetical protein